MNKKLFIGIAPLLAIAALAVMPVAAQAATHWYKNGAAVPEGEALPVVGWGEITLTSAAGVMTCQVSVYGTVGNQPSGGVGQTESFATSQCAAASCPLEARAETPTLPWGSTLEEPEVGLRRSMTIGVELLVGCWSGPPTGLGSEEQGTPVGELLPFVGGLTPRVSNGTTASKPSKVEFGAGSGELINGTVGGGKLTGNYAFVGYNSQEVITAGP